MIRRATYKFNLYNKRYEIEPGASETVTFDSDKYLVCNFIPKNYASMIKLNSEGKNTSL